jgi:uncharacterized membrane protein YGL010W
MTEQELLSKYAESHQNLQNQKIHTVCVPIIFLSVISMLFWFMPVWIFAVIMGAILAYYYQNLRSVFFPMLGFLILCLGIIALISTVPYFLWINMFLFIVGWIGQFWGHNIEGKKPSFFEDIFFLLVGPGWVMHKLKTK